jgi:hypothetical protein
MGHKDPKIMITKDYLIMFYLNQQEKKKRDATNLNEEEEKFDYIGV